MSRVDHHLTAPEDIDADPEEILQAYGELKEACDYWNQPYGKTTKTAVEDARDILKEQLWGDVNGR